jgi:hypothetical protein
MTGFDRDLLHAVGRLRRRWKARVLTEGAAKVAVAALLALLAGVALTVLLGSGSATVVTMRVLGYVLIAAAAVRYLLLPAFGRPDDVRLALYVEERAPELRQTLVSAVHELRIPAEERPSPALAARVVEQALAEVRRLESGPGLERPRLRRAAGLFAAVATAGVLLVLAGPRVLLDTARVLFIPWREAAAAPVLAVEVSPGDATVPRGGAVEVRAALHGFGADGAELVIRADTSAEWIRLPMLRDSSTAGFNARLFDLTRVTEYYVEADGIRSRAYRLTISDLPAVQRLSLELRFPAYTRLPPERIEDGGDVAAVRGTTVVVHARITRPVRSGALRIDGAADVPLATEADGRLTGSFRVARDGFYHVDLVAADGTPVPGAVPYAIEALEDHPPTVAIERPGRDTKVTSVEEVTISARASDDYGVGGFELRYSVNGGAEQRVVLTDSTARGASREVRAAHTLFLEELGLKPGDLIAYHASATDGAGTTASSDIYFLQVRPFGLNYHQADAGPAGGGGQAESPDGLSARQRDIVAGTFNWLRDSARTAERERRENLTTLAIAQGRLKEDVAGLVRRLVERGVVASDSTFREVHAELEAAGREMQAAEEGLGKGLPREALPAEQKALQHAQRAEAAYRDIDIQLGGQSGGGEGGKASRAEDLADLFDLETDKLRNQYESVQRDREQSAQQEIDQTLERLRQLASRQQQESERMQRMADALRERLGREGSAGGGGSPQRELARQAEEEARRLERLARERNSPELTEAARRLQESADAMRRAASGSPKASSDAREALDRLRGAAQTLENARGAGLAQGVRGLQQRAEELGARQREIAKDVADLPGSGANDRPEKLRRLDERKDGLAAEIERLQTDAERLARESRRDQPGAAGKVGQAAETIQKSRLHDKVLDSKRVMRSGSPEYAKNREAEITANLGDVAGQLREAVGALSESAEARRDRAIEGARELVRGLESLRDRIRDKSQGGQNNPAARGQQGQPGQSGQQGQQGQQGQSGQPGQPGPAQPGGQNSEGAPGGGTGVPGGRLGGGDARQFAREFRLRREAAESLRRDLANQGVPTGELDRALDDLRRLESGRPFSDPKGLAELQQQVIEGLKTWEFMLWRRLGLLDGNRPALGAPVQAPAEYRALVEEYYRALARPKPPR